MGSGLIIYILFGFKYGVCVWDSGLGLRICRVQDIGLLAGLGLGM